MRTPYNAGESNSRISGRTVRPSFLRASEPVLLELELAVAEVEELRRATDTGVVVFDGEQTWAPVWRLNAAGSK